MVLISAFLFIQAKICFDNVQRILGAKVSVWSIVVNFWLLFCYYYAFIYLVHMTRNFQRRYLKLGRNMCARIVAIEYIFRWWHSSKEHCFRHFYKKNLFLANFGPFLSPNFCKQSVDDLKFQKTWHILSFKGCATIMRITQFFHWGVHL